jgi:site-specific DNA-methyltransferase (adenine-specific)
VIDLRLGDCLEVMRTLADNTVDSVVTDPPYGIRFMGMAWDGQDIERRAAERRSAASSDPQATDRGGHKSIAAEAGKYDRAPSAMLAFQEFSEAWAREALRVLKPGGHLLSFASTRTYHRMAAGIEDAGFELRDQIGWVFGSGFPKSHNGPWGGTALKPAWEPICVARKPLIGTVEQNWFEHGTGALNIDGCRIQTAEALRAGAGGIPCRHDEHTPRGRAGEASAAARYQDDGGTDFAMTPGPRGGDAKGRWPANLIHDGSDEVVALFPREAGAAAPCKVRNADKFRTAYGAFKGNRDEAGSTFHGDSGSAARFFYCAKADRADRNDGLHGMPSRETKHYGQTMNNGSGGLRNGDGSITPQQNHHPTVKPTDLMRYLCRLVTPAGGLILDPFMGSGSTGRGAVLEGFRFIGIEREAEYIEIAQARIDSARRQGHQPDLLEHAA